MCSWIFVIGILGKGNIRDGSSTNDDDDDDVSNVVGDVDGAGVGDVDDGRK